MELTIPESALRFGFVLEPTGGHAGKTILVPELTMLLGAAPGQADHEELRHWAIEENVLLKMTTSNRLGVFHALRRLYGLRSSLLLFRAFQVLWASSDIDGPVLALLLASARDSSLRVSAAAIVDKPIGDVVTTVELVEILAAAYGERYSAKTRQSMAEHLKGSWAQAGYLGGRTVKRRSQVVIGPESVAFALLLGYLCGARGLMLYETFWVRLLDLPAEQIDRLTFAAAQRGWLTYRRIGDVAEIAFPMFVNEDSKGKLLG